MVAFMQSKNLIMLVDLKVLTKNGAELLEQMCVVVNVKTLLVSPLLSIGSWVKRCGPWEKVEGGTYTDKQIQTWLSTK